MKYYSLRRRTLRAFMAPMLIAMALITLVAALLAYSNISDIDDQQMDQSARLLMLLAKHEAAERDSLEQVEGTLPMFPTRLIDTRSEFRIWSDSGVVTQSDGMPNLPRFAVAGFSNSEVDGTSWRIYVLKQSNPAISVELAEPGSLRTWLTAEMMVSLIVPFALLGLAVAAIGSWQIRRALEPLVRLSTQLDKREGQDLAPVGGSELPEEVAPLVVALNHLFGRVRDAFDREREFSDNAAHELRTPLAALKTRAQLVTGKLSSQPELRADMGQFVEALDRAAHVIDRLLEFARLSGPSHVDAVLDLSALVEDVAREAGPDAIAKRIEYGVDIAPGVLVSGNSATLRLAMRNIVENAVKFTPRGGEIAIGLVRNQGWARVVVSDDGPGLQPGDEQRVFERFWRANSEQPGSGLGLALVAKVAAAHGGHAVARRRIPNGLDVELSLPAV